MTRYPMHHHVYSQKGINCPICGAMDVAGAMIEGGKTITRRDIRRSRWKRYRYSWGA